MPSSWLIGLFMIALSVGHFITPLCTYFDPSKFRDLCPLFSGPSSNYPPGGQNMSIWFPVCGGDWRKSISKLVRVYLGSCHYLSKPLLSSKYLLLWWVIVKCWLRIWLWALRWHFEGVVACWVLIQVNAVSIMPKVNRLSPRTRESFYLPSSLWWVHCVVGDIFAIQVICFFACWLLLWM